MKWRERERDIEKQDVDNEAERVITLERSVLLDVKRERNKMKEMTKKLKRKEKRLKVKENREKK